MARMAVGQVAEVDKRLFWKLGNRRGKLCGRVQRRQRWLGEVVGGTEQS